MDADRARGEPAGVQTVLLTAIAATVFLAIAVALLQTVLGQPNRPVRLDIDFLIYREAVPHLLSDDVYEPLFESLPFAYPPSALLFLAPAALPAESVARVLWFLLGLSGAWLAMRLTAQEAAPSSWWSTLPGSVLLTAGALLTFPIQTSLLAGQVPAILMGMVAIAALGRHRVTDGPLLGVATSIKLTPGLFAVWWWIIGRRKDAAIAGATTLAVFALGWLFMPDSSIRYFLQGGMFDLDRNSPARRISNQSLYGVAARAGLEGAWERALWISLTVLITGWALNCARQLAGAGQLAVAVSLVGVWSAIAAPLAWTHAFVWWAPLGTAIGLSGLPRSRGVAAAIWVVAFIPVFPLQSHTPLLDGILGILYPATAILATYWSSRRINVGASPWARVKGMRPRTAGRSGRIFSDGEAGVVAHGRYVI